MEPEPSSPQTVGQTPEADQALVKAPEETDGAFAESTKTNVKVDGQYVFDEYAAAAAAAAAAVRALDASDEIADDIAACDPDIAARGGHCAGDFKPHKISACTYKFTSGGAFRTRCSEIVTEMKDKRASAIKYSQQDIDPDTPCKACGERLGKTSARFNYSGNSCSNCGARFHKCADGEIKYGNYEFFECPECKKSPSTCSLPSAHYSDIEAEEASMTLNCPVCDMGFKAQANDGRAGGGITPIQFMKTQAGDGAFSEPQAAKMARCLLCNGVLVGLASWNLKDIATRTMTRADPPEFKYCAGCKVAFCLDANNIPIKGVVLP